jgi:cystathionine beta-lyase/cystathionine gamma-synthase
VAGPGDIVAEIMRMSRTYGPALDAHAAWLLDRGLRTLEIRVRRHNENALALARWFEGRPRVARVLHPGLESHPDHALARELLSGFGGMLSIVLGGGGEAADRFTGALKLALVAPSLGGVETLVSQPRYTSHAGLTPAEREAQGIVDGFVRISVGVEDLADLQADFAAALAASA